MEKLAGGSSRSAHHSFPAVTRCHALLRCLFNGTLPPPPPVHHSPLSLSPSSSVLAAAHFPSSSAAAYKPSLRFRNYLTILSSIDSFLTPLLVHAHTLRDVALLLLLLLLHHHQKNTLVSFPRHLLVCVSFCIQTSFSPRKKTLIHTKLFLSFFPPRIGTLLSHLPTFANFWQFFQMIE
jgi:hypothetical protein